MDSTAWVCTKTIGNVLETGSDSDKCKENFGKNDYLLFFFGDTV